MIEEFLRPLASTGLAQPVEAAEQHQVLLPGQPVVDGHLLPGDHDRAPHSGRLGDHVVAGDVGRAGIRAGQGGQDVHHSRLARPVRAE